MFRVQFLDERIFVAALDIYKCKLYNVHMHKKGSEGNVAEM